MFDKEGDTVKTGNDGSDAQLTQPTADPIASVDVATQESATSATIRPPFHGFDPKGQDFVVQIDVRHGYLTILGFLEEAKDFLKAHVAMQRMEEEKKKLIVPQKKSSSRFSLFKGK